MSFKDNTIGKRSFPSKSKYSEDDQFNGGDGCKYYFPKLSFFSYFRKFLKIKNFQLDKNLEPFDFNQK